MRGSVVAAPLAVPRGSSRRPVARDRVRGRPAAPAGDGTARGLDVVPGDRAPEPPRRRARAGGRRLAGQRHPAGRRADDPHGDAAAHRPSCGRSLDWRAAPSTSRRSSSGSTPPVTSRRPGGARTSRRCRCRRSSSRLETAPFGMGSGTDRHADDGDGLRPAGPRPAGGRDGGGRRRPRARPRSRRSSPARAPYELPLDGSIRLLSIACRTSLDSPDEVTFTIGSSRPTARPSRSRLGAADVAGQRRIGRGRGLRRSLRDGVRRLRRDRRDRPPSARCPCSWRLRSRRGTVRSSGHARRTGDAAGAGRAGLPVPVDGPEHPVHGRLRARCSGGPRPSRRPGWS